MEEANPFGYVSKIRAMKGFRAALMTRLHRDWSRLPGCVAYIVAEDLVDADLLWVTEFWEDRGILEEALKDGRLFDSMGAARALTVAHELRVEIRPVFAPVAA